MSAPDLVSDCSQCAALCCMVFAFEKGVGFGTDKPAGVGCPHLNDDFGCGVYGLREKMGFDGCLRFDCLGAGQRVTQGVFPGLDWRKRPDRIPLIIEAFRKLREVHRLHELLQTARALPMTPEQDTHWHVLRDRLQVEDDALDVLDDQVLTRDVETFLAGFRAVAAQVVKANKA